MRFAKQVNSPAASKIDKEKYFFICEQMGHTPDPTKIPLDLGDFPEIVHIGMAIFNSLRDHYIPAEIPVYTGKDLTALPVLFDIYEITSTVDKEFILRIINILDREAVEAYKKKMPKPTKKPILPDIKGGGRS